MPLKGDTLFGQFCWQAAYDASLLKLPFTEAISCYADQRLLFFQQPALRCQGVAWP